MCSDSLYNFFFIPSRKN